jgi:hypothetical protein
MDCLPVVSPVYKRDLRPEDYYIGYLLHPYVWLYTGRGCRSRCTFCLWPQTVGGHRHPTRSVDNVLAGSRRSGGTCRKAKSGSPARLVADSMLLVHRYFPITPPPRS